MKIYILMCLGDIIDKEYYTDEEMVAKRAESLNTATESMDFWYQTLTKKHEWE